MQLQEDGRTSNVRAMFELTGTPFTVATYRQREVIFSQGDPCDGVMHIEKGRVWLAVSASSGKEAIVDLLRAGAFLGEEAICGHQVRRETATAMSATEVIVVEKTQMVWLLRTQQELSDRFIAHILARHFRLEASLTDQLLAPASSVWRARCSCSPAAASGPDADACCLISLKRSSRKWSAPHARV